MKAILTRIADEVTRKYRELPKDFDGSVEVGRGASGSATSRIDKYAEDTVLDYLDEEKVPLNVLSEEVGYVDRGAKQTLVLDPIDGTLNCIRRIPFFSVSLAVGRNRLTDCDHALVRNILSGDTYYARRGGGAELNGHRIAVSGYSRDDAMFAVFEGIDVGAETERVKQLARRVRTLGCASLEMCLVAQGSFQAHYMNCTEFSRMIRIVDIAASALILREAGGEVVDLKGEKLEMAFDLKDRKNFLAYGDPKLKELVLRG